MMGIVYTKPDNKIIGIVQDVISYTETDIIGKDGAVKGIDLEKADFCIVESTYLQIGDTLGSFTDVRQQLPPSPEALIAELQQQVADLNQLLIEKGISP
jgi:hypothetical protein